MKVVHGDLWEYHRKGAYVAVTTNLETKAAGGSSLAIMGRGLAQQAAQRFPELQRRYARDLIQQEPFQVYADWKLIMFPTKLYWRRSSEPRLIEQSMTSLRAWCLAHPQAWVALPPPGCGLGGLDWATQVRPLLLPLLEDLPRVALVLPDGWE